MSRPVTSVGALVMTLTHLAHRILPHLLSRLPRVCPVLDYGSLHLFTCSQMTVGVVTSMIPEMARSWYYPLLLGGLILVDPWEFPFHQVSSWPQMLPPSKSSLSVLPSSIHPTTQSLQIFYKARHEWTLTPFPFEFSFSFPKTSRT